MRTQAQNQLLLIWVALALLLDFIPYLKWPFLWSETFFHEISHGFAALLSGGSIKSITLNYDGSGHCVSQGGVRFVTAFSGYMGSALWGLMIYLSAINSRPGQSRILMSMLIALLTATLILWAEGLSTYLILGVLITAFAFSIRLSAVRALKYLLQFIGVFVILDAIRSPLALLDGQKKGDGAILSELTYLPEVIWVAVWFVLALFCLLAAYRMGRSRTKVSWA